MSSVERRHSYTRLIKMLFIRVQETNIVKFRNWLMINLVAGALAACNLTAEAPQERTPQPISTRDVAQAPSPTPTVTLTATPTPTRQQTADDEVTACVPQTNWMTYVVVAGDTLGAIARRAGTSATELARANCLADANTIRVGQVLRVPALLPPVTPTTTSNIGNIPVFSSGGNPSIDLCWAAHPGSTAVVNLYQYPASSNGGAPSGFIGRLGDWAVVVSASYNGWYQIAFGDGTRGWVDGATITLGGTCSPLILLKDELPVVGDVAGQPDLSACWASNPGDGVLVYDAPLLDPMDAKAILSNRALVTAIHNAGYYIINYVPDGVGYVDVGDVTLIGDCSGLLADES